MLRTFFSSPAVSSVQNGMPFIRCLPLCGVRAAFRRSVTTLSGSDPSLVSEAPLPAMASRAAAAAGSAANPPQTSDADCPSEVALSEPGVQPTAAITRTAADSTSLWTVDRME